MNVKVFEEACRLSCLEWAATLPDAPEYTLSKQAKKRLEIIVSHMEGGRYRRVSKRAARIIAAAAVVSALLIATTAFAVMSQSDFDILRRSDMSEYAVADANGQALNSDLKVSYVVDGFELSETNYDDNSILINYVYSNQNGNLYSVRKIPDSYSAAFDNDEYEARIVTRNDIDYTYYRSADDVNGIIWNYNHSVYCVSGDISLDEAFKVADSITY